jgi:hypothetical protein
MEMEMMQVETMSAFACHVTAPQLTAMLVVGHFFLLHVAVGWNHFDLCTAATSRIGQWPGVDLALVIAVTTLILG